jgi:hypothetical protein
MASARIVRRSSFGVAHRRRHLLHLRGSFVIAVKIAGAA